MAETNDLRGPEHSLAEEQSALPPRLVSSVASLQPQEVRGGFPVTVKAEVRRDTDVSSYELVGGSARAPSAFRNYGLPESGSLAPLRQAELPEPPAAVSSVALSGIHIRVLKPDELAAATQRSGNNIAEAGRSSIEEPKAHTSASAAPPPLDIDAVADRVYQVLQRRHRLERERRGLY
jgi:hypothetical protein